MAQPPHVTHTVSSCRTQLEHSTPGLTVTTVAPSRAPIAISGNLIARLFSVFPPQDGQAINYALGTLQYRKQKNRKRTPTGEYVWSEEADLVFTLALVNWTSNRARRLGGRRANFLQRFLARNGFYKSRKQIASRLQVLKGEWKRAPYLSLLEDPDRSSLKQARTMSSSPSPSVGSEQGSAATPRPSAPPNTPAISSQSNYGGEHDASDHTTRPDLASLSFLFPPIVEDDKSALRRLIQIQGGCSKAGGRRLELDKFATPEAPLQVVNHHLPLHAPTAMVPSHNTTQNLLPRPPNHAPDFFIPQKPRYCPYPSCVQCGPQTSAPGRSFYQPRPFAY